MTTEPTTIPAWLNLDAIHPPDELADLDGIVDEARGVLEAVVAFNRKYVKRMRDYYDRNDYGPGDVSEVVDEATGMKQVDGYLLLTGYLIECTVIGQGTVTQEYAKVLLHEHAGHVSGVRAIGGGTHLPTIDEAPTLSEALPEVQD